MTEPSPRFMEIFLEVFESLPRQGPGNRASAAKALALCGELPPSPAVIDLGCGVGGQTMHLAEMTSGTIVAVDSHAPSIERLRLAVAEHKLSERVWPVVGDLTNLGQTAASFDLVWTEGALYNVGLDKGLPICRALLRPGGYLAFTEPVWCKDDPPAEVKASFEDYPAMGRVADVLAAIERHGFGLVGHFPLPHEAWRDDFYTPMEARIEELRGQYANDDEALAVLAQIAREPEMYRQYSDYYAYEFFVARRGG